MVVMRSCCCCNTRSGTAIIAILYMLFTGAVVIILGITLNSGNLFMTKGFLIGVLVVKIIYFIICILLFIGASKESPSYLLPWIIVEFLRQFLAFGIFIYALVYGGMSFAAMHNLAVNNATSVSQITDTISPIIAASTAALFFVGFPIICLTFYFWLAVIAAYQVFREQDRIIPVQYPDQYPKSSSTEAFANY